MALNSYRQFTTTRAAVNAGAWNPVIIPAGAELRSAPESHDVLLGSLG